MLRFTKKLISLLIVVFILLSAFGCVWSNEPSEEELKAILAAIKADPANADIIPDDMSIDEFKAFLEENIASEINAAEEINKADQPTKKNTQTYTLTEITPEYTTSGMGYAGDGLLWATYSQGGNIGFLDENGKVIIEPVYRS